MKLSGLGWITEKEKGCYQRCKEKVRYGRRRKEIGKNLAKKAFSEKSWPLERVAICSFGSSSDLNPIEDLVSKQPLQEVTFQRSLGRPNDSLVSSIIQS